MSVYKIVSLTVPEISLYVRAASVYEARCWLACQVHQTEESLRSKVVILSVPKSESRRIYGIRPVYSTGGGF